ncbi:zinc finger protein 429-like [Belonocnema kinseyi]|uniref:zinc finger protein 429-like n=1 Tax=Belonocnema kinseyi TaxID=2817044 RepID=UPI00143D6A54|nr:zinc finger protein 429-like [Belonocnema kinseyi]
MVFLITETSHPYNLLKSTKMQTLEAQKRPSASTNTKNFKSFSKKSAERPDGGAHSTLHSSHFLEFETVFVKPESEKHSLICEGNPLDAKSMVTKISSDNSHGKISTCMIEYEHDATLEIKDEIIQGQETVASQKCNEKYYINLHSAHMSEANSYGAKKKVATHQASDSTNAKRFQSYSDSGHFMKFETVFVNHERAETSIICEGNPLDIKYISTEISSHKSDAKISTCMIEYEHDTTLEIKEEIIHGQETVAGQKCDERNDINLHSPHMSEADIYVAQKNLPTHQPSALTNTKRFQSYSKISTEKPDCLVHSALHPGHFMEFETVFVKQEREDSLICEGNPLDETPMATQISTDNSKGKISTCMIEYEHGTTMKIKKIITQGQETATGQKCGEKYGTKLHTAHMRDADTCGVKKKFPTLKKQKVQESKFEMNRTCEKCARSYINKWALNRHQKFECGVIPQFGCEFCDKRFKRNVHLQQHIVRMHHKTEIKASQKKYNCNKCSRSYSSANGLNSHIRLEHSAVKPEFTCDYCLHKSKTKCHLSRHISSKHLNK